MNEWIKEEIINYVRTGQLYSNFLSAVLTNDLRESFARADDYNQRNMVEIVKFLYNKVPGICWGSPERVQKWIDAGGAEGQNIETEITCLRGTK